MKEKLILKFTFKLKVSPKTLKLPEIKLHFSNESEILHPIYSIYANPAAHCTRTRPCEGPFYCAQCASHCVKANIFNGMGSPTLYCTVHYPASSAYSVTH